MKRLDKTLLIIAWLIPFLSFGQTNVEIFKEANLFFEQNNYESALKNLNFVNSKLGKSNAVIEHLKVKCYYELNKNDKAQKHLNEFFKYKAADYLIEEMLEYAELIRKKKIADKRESIKKESKKQSAFFEETIKQSSEKSKEVKNEVEKLEKVIADRSKFNEYAPFRKFHQNFINRDVERLNQFKEGKIYVFHGKEKPNASLYKNEVSYFVYYGNKYVIISIPSKTVVSKLNKETTKFYSSDAITVSLEGKIKLVLPKVKTPYGNKSYTFFPCNAKKGQNIGGAGDEIIQVSHLTQYKVHDFYYHHADKQLLAVPNHLLTQSTLMAKDKVQTSNPVVELGSVSLDIDYMLIEDSKTKALLERKGVYQKTKSDMGSRSIISLSLRPNGRQNILGIHKKIQYSLNSDKIIKGYLDEGGTLTNLSFYYYRPYYKLKEYYSRQVSGNSTPDKKTNVFYNLAEADEGITLSKEEFNLLYEDFSQSGNVKDESYDLIKKIAEIKKKSIQLSNSEFTHLINFSTKISDPILGTYDSWKDKIGSIINKDKYGEYNTIVTWGSSNGFNNIAWKIYENSEDPEMLKIGLKFVQRSIELHEDFANLDTYAHILAKLGNKTKAFEIMNKAIDIGENRAYSALDSYPKGAFSKYAEEFKSFRDSLKK